MTLTLTRWPSYTHLIRIPSRYSGCAKRNFLHQGLRKLSHYRHIHTYIRTIYTHTSVCHGAINHTSICHWGMKSALCLTRSNRFWSSGEMSELSVNRTMHNEICTVEWLVHQNMYFYTASDMFQCELYWWKKTQNKTITAFKVIQGHRSRYQSKARMRLPISD